MSAHRDSGAPQGIAQPESERLFRSDHHEIDRQRLRRIDDRDDVTDSDWEIGGDFGGARVAGRAVHGVHPWASGQFPGERVFASAPANDQNAEPHALPPLLAMPTALDRRRAMIRATQPARPPVV